MAHLTRAQRIAKQQAKAEKGAAVKTFGADNMNAGNYVIDKFIKSGSLGRISTGQMMNPDGTPQTDAQGNPIRIGENQDVLNRYKDLSKGMSADQYQAAREQQMKGMNSGLQTQMGQLAKAQARGKVYGAAGAAQQANALQGYQNSVADIEQQNKLADINLIREGTDKYAGSLAGMQTAERQGQEFNLGQVAAEKAGQMGAYFNTIGIGKGQKNTDRQMKMQEKALGVSGSGRRGGGGGSSVKEPDVTGGKPSTPNVSTVNPYQGRTQAQRLQALAKSRATRR